MADTIQNDTVQMQFTASSASGRGLKTSELEPSRKQDNDPDKIVRELVSQFLNCSTTISGIFCW